MHELGTWRTLLTLTLALALGACGDDGKAGGQGDAGDVIADTVAPDADATLTDADAVAPDADAAVPDSDAVGPDADAATDTETDTGPPPLKVHAPLSAAPDPLAGSAVQSCSLYLDERCDGGTLRRCAVYDPATEAFVDDPDPLLRRAFLFDRWRDLYNSPDGQAVDRDFAVAVAPGTPESEWGRPEAFAGYFGTGDGGIWTGWSTVAAILRYSQTGTEADYQRMEQQVRDMVTMYEVTGIPGYLVRTHYLLLPAGAPNSPDHVLRWEGSFTPNHHDRLIPNPETIDNLPAIYTEGIADADGKVWKGTPMWKGRPSIDQNTGPMTSLPMAYGLLRDEGLKQKIATNLTCYLKRLQRIELINLQQNPELLDSLVAYFNIGELKLDPEDLDLTKLDRIVGYVHRQINSLNEADFDRGCPDTVQLEPWRVIDATDDSFALELLALVQDFDVDAERKQGVDHYYFPSIRGGDAMHMMHLASMAYYFTGDEMYRSFLYDELIGNLNTLEVMHTAGAFDLPKFCKKYYGDQITFGPWWAFLHLLDDSPLRDAVAKDFHDEMWRKLLMPARNVDFEIMYAGALDPEVALDRAEALSGALDDLSWMGGNGGASQGDAFDAKWLDDPRRAYTLDPAVVLAQAPDGQKAVCPTQNNVDNCSATVNFLGVELPNLTGWGTYACTGSDLDCDLGEGQCTEAMTDKALPPPLRPHTDYLWQRNPFEIGRSTGLEGGRQYAGSDYSVPYWNARRYGFLSGGAGQVLAWQDAGSCAVAAAP
ncbi:MAG: hypothetical protein H6744_05310 [Deltaproteobacteria bacterium]|nr:hypothetical protein [Deltaproteobacteria bacterium]MCB9786096.1 hypothetical protein [Deltaproteobacteria bacterium]